MISKQTMVRLATLVSGSLLAASAVMANNYPQKPITVMVGFPPGTSTDTVARILGEKMSKDLGQPIIIKNKPGAGGTRAPTDVARADPDGYTLLISATAPMGSAAHLMKNLPYSPLKDFEPIGQTSWLPYLLVTNKTKGLDTYEKVIEYARANPEKLTYASIGEGTTSHLIMATFLNKAGVKMTHIPYKGSAQSLADVIGGNVDMTFDTLVSEYPHVKSGRLNAVVVSTAKRAEMDSNIPTAQEKGIKDFNLGAWLGYFAPKGTPKDVVDKLHKALNDALKDPETNKKLQALGSEVVMSASPQEFGKFVEFNYNLWGDIIKQSGVKLQQ